MVKLSQPFGGFLGSPIFLFAQLSSGAEGSDVQDIERVFNALSQLPAVLQKIEIFWSTIVHNAEFEGHKTYFEKQMTSFIFEWYWTFEPPTQQN